ncbi:hypothetical protein C8J27_106202 [Rhodobacter aestuarii]|uniref:Uncharacterized protein n=1 Tax=Rhodobacter aestuarii TaxID=453582 RepID=A0A1N7M9L7_9RHOB|nr:MULTISPECIES: hypothetical protein [Rhodobacter]PTV94933.1 hypothetical protein C8J27_106202 [Rhodobacter aestuarii]SIS82661.1 hypothetical protein SAMN05421580_105202 [Rhodobacter aestuarii]SOC16780.1 hypothetical protein SAMN05877809_1092 [Rhodobacter sp. JA431]
MENIVWARVVFYALSSLLAAMPAAWAGWGLSYDAATGILSINIETLAGVFVGALLASGGVMALWGKK